MTQWLLDTIKDSLEQAKHEANKTDNIDYDLIDCHANVLELIILDLQLETSHNVNQDLLRKCAADAFGLLRVIPNKSTPILQAENILRCCVLAVIGDRKNDAAQLLREKTWDKLPLDSQDWGEKTWATTLEIWLRLICNQGSEDCEFALKLIDKLRKTQGEFELNYLKSKSNSQAKYAALELIALYHLAKAAEIVAHYLSNGVVETSCSIAPLLKNHFDYALLASKQTNLYGFILLLSISVKALIDNAVSSQTIGQQILEQFKETGYLGCFSDVINLSSNHKEYLDFREKV
jgi:hypothetical protein